MNNKGLEKAIEWLKNNIRYYEEQVEYINKIDSDYYDEEKDLYLKRIEIFKNTLNYIENSISKEVIEKKIKKLESQYKEALEENSIQVFILKCQIEIFKRIIRGKIV